jgi:hypothetical protein
MPDRIRCTCRRCTANGLMGPAILITLGVLFLLDQWHGGGFGFGRSWPVILLVIGLVKLAAATASDAGHNTVLPPGSQPPGQS